jgi:hypothetical protein
MENLQSKYILSEIDDRIFDIISNDVNRLENLIIYFSEINKNNINIEYQYIDISMNLI